MDGYISYIKFSGYCDKFGQFKENEKTIVGHKVVLKYLTKEV